VGESPVQECINTTWDFLRENDLNICYNDQIGESYNPDKKNVLLAIESPAVIEHKGWLQPDYDFHAEISFNNFYDLDNYYCCRRLYVCHDGWASFDPNRDYTDKTDLVSMVYSERSHLPGHKLRHEAASKHGGLMDTYGSGTGKWLEDKKDSLASYQFQVVIENGKYPEYVSEKFFDCLKTNTVPIYYGGKEAVRKLGFDTDGVIFFDNIKELAEILSDKVSPSLYDKLRPATERNRERLMELRTERKQEFYLDTVYLSYLHSLESYQDSDYSKMNVAIDR
jgi:hypothetical protein